MEKVIGQLYEIEEKAHRILRRATEEKTQLHDEYELKIKRLEQEISEDTAIKLKKLQNQADEDLSREIQQLKQENERLLKELDEINSDKHELLINQVFDNIIKA